jgi:hypothetical protein
VIQAFYWDPDNEAIVETTASAVVLEDLVASMIRLRSLRGCPVLELRRPDGSSVSLGTDGERAVVVWINSLGESFTSVGSWEGPTLVYDYFGSWTEAPGASLVTHADAVRCLARFLVVGSPATQQVLFTPD